MLLAGAACLSDENSQDPRAIQPYRARALKQSARAIGLQCYWLCSSLSRGRPDHRNRPFPDPVRGLAWPLRQDDTHKSGSVLILFGLWFRPGPVWVLRDYIRNPNVIAPAKFSGFARFNFMLKNIKISLGRKLDPGIKKQIANPKTRPCLKRSISGRPREP